MRRRIPDFLDRKRSQQLPPENNEVGRGHFLSVLMRGGAVKTPLRLPSALRPLINKEKRRFYVVEYKIWGSERFIKPEALL